jgi:hypothetical protein
VIKNFILLWPHRNLCVTLVLLSAAQLTQDVWPQSRHQERRHVGGDAAGTTISMGTTASYRSRATIPQFLSKKTDVSKPASLSAWYSLGWQICWLGVNFSVTGAHAYFFLDFAHTENQTRPRRLTACSSPGWQIFQLTLDKLELKNSAHRGRVFHSWAVDTFGQFFDNYRSSARF